MKPWLKNRKDKSARVNIFLEHPLTDEFRHYLRMNPTSYIDFYILITYTFYISYTYIMKHAFITSSYTDF